MHPAAPGAWLSFPVLALRVKTVIELLSDEATYTLWPLGLMARASEPRRRPGPRSARTGVHP